RKGRLDFRRTLRAALRRDGEAVTLLRRRRKTRMRPVVLLIDVSGSMKARTDERLAFAHALVAAGERVEVFTLGTRLTRITPELRARERGQALARVGRLVADFDGGTRIGEALAAFLVNEIQEVYRLQGVKINDKHIEVIVRQMLQKIEISASGDSTLLPGEQVDRVEFDEINEKLEAQGKRPAEGEPVLLGITKASSPGTTRPRRSCGSATTPW
ncbi:MAG: VWA domain-containing protein, partial [Pseudomonadota bacterium]